MVAMWIRLSWAGPGDDTAVYSWHRCHHEDVTEPDEHVRWREYRHALSEVPEAGEMSLAAEVLAGPDTVMAVSALVGHVDSRAATSHGAAGFDAWARQISDAAAGHPFLLRRIHRGERARP
jgi:hypothetical protein